MRALVIGHFSTVGDIESLEYVQSVLNDRGMDFDILPYNPKFVPFIDRAIGLAEVDPGRYSHLIAVCGPFWPELLDKRGISLDRFAHCTRIGVNLTMVRPPADWNPFHLLLERDSDRATRPDITFLQAAGRVPVAGLCTIARQREYGARQRHGEAVGLLEGLAETRRLATIEVDTRWPRHRNSGGLGSPAEVMSVIERLDVLLTNRLHGLVYALRAGVPVLAVDPVHGGDKVVAQARALGWPGAIPIEEASPASVERMLDWCLSADGRSAAQSAASRAPAALQSTDEAFRAALRTTPERLPLPPLPDSSKAGLGQRIARALRIGG